MYKRMESKITIKISNELLQSLDIYVMKHNTTRSEAIRRAIEMMLKSEKTENVNEVKVEKGFRLW
jgi:metal-responsive CopG/Arc/MetJ family transcriptional regulator